MITGTTSSTIGEYQAGAALSGSGNSGGSLAAQTSGEDSVRLSTTAQVAALHQSGMSARQIASSLGLSTAEVDSYLGISTSSAPTGGGSAPAGGGRVPAHAGSGHTSAASKPAGESSQSLDAKVIRNSS